MINRIAATILAILFVLIFIPCTVSAEEVSVDSGLVVTGAQIRTVSDEKSQGLRFKAELDKSLIESLDIIEYGFVVIPSKYVPSGEKVEMGDRFTYLGKTYKAKTVPAENVFLETEDKIVFTVCITGTKAANYDRTFTAVPYVISYNGDCFYAQSYSTSIVNVAKAIVADKKASSSDKQAAKGLLDDYENAQWSGIYKP